LTESQKRRAARKAEHVAREINAQAWRDRLGDHWFDWRGRPCRDPELTSESNGRPLYGAPQFRTIQFTRTTRRPAEL